MPHHSSPHKTLMLPACLRKPTNSSLGGATRGIRDCQARRSGWVSEGDCLLRADLPNLQGLPLTVSAIFLPPHIRLTDEQVTEMKIKDEWTPRCYPSGGSRPNRDDIGRRTGNGRVPSGRAPRKAHLFLLHMHALPLARTSARGSFVTTAQLIVKKIANIRQLPWRTWPKFSTRLARTRRRRCPRCVVRSVFLVLTFSSFETDA